MAPVLSPQALLSRMEDARRQTQRQLDLIERQITRRMTTILPQLALHQTRYRRKKSARWADFTQALQGKSGRIDRATPA